MIEVLPLALTMMVGPQIITAIILVTAKDVIHTSVAYIGGIAASSTIGTLVFVTVARIFNLSAPGSQDPSRLSLLIQAGLITLLIVAVLVTYLNRSSSSLPRWMKGLQDATPKKAFAYGLMLIFLMPTDLIAMATVGVNIASHQAGSMRLLPFISMTVFIAAVPLLIYLIFKKKAVVAMPKIRRWMDDNSWLVSIAAYVLFIYLIWA